ncbi:MAG: flagellar export chaperone FlgN [Kineosporiaceae bacterium]
MGFAEVSGVLWRERELLELLLFKLEEEQLVLAGGRARWLPHATREVEAVLGGIRRAELLRRVELERLAGELGLSGDVPLRELADASPPPWDELFRSHRAAFLALTGEITALAEANRDLLAAGARSVTEALLSTGLVEATATYDATGRAPTRSGGSHLVDHVS